MNFNLSDFVKRINPWYVFVTFLYEILNFGSLGLLILFVIFFLLYSEILVYFSLIAFTILFALRLDGTIEFTYWIVFFPLWIWKIVVFTGAFIGVRVWWKQPAIGYDSFPVDNDRLALVLGRRGRRLRLDSAQMRELRELFALDLDPALAGGFGGSLGDLHDFDVFDLPPAALPVAPAPPSLVPIPLMQPSLTVPGTTSASTLGPSSVLALTSQASSSSVAAPSASILSSRSPTSSQSHPTAQESSAIGTASASTFQATPLIASSPPAASAAAAAGPSASSSGGASTSRDRSVAQSQPSVVFVPAAAAAPGVGRVRSRGRGRLPRFLRRRGEPRPVGGVPSRLRRLVSPAPGSPDVQFKSMMFTTFVNLMLLLFEVLALLRLEYPSLHIGAVTVCMPYFGAGLVSIALCVWDIQNDLSFQVGLSLIRNRLLALNYRTQLNRSFRL